MLAVKNVKVAYPGACCKVLDSVHANDMHQLIHAMECKGRSKHQHPNQPRSSHPDYTVTGTGATNHSMYALWAMCCCAHLLIHWFVLCACEVCHECHVLLTRVGGQPQLVPILRLPAFDDLIIFKIPGGPDDHSNSTIIMVGTVYLHDMLHGHMHDVGL